jgi:hypothetical protein
MSKDDEIMELKRRLDCVIFEKHALEDIAARKQKPLIVFWKYCPRITQC